MPSSATALFRSELSLCMVPLPCPFLGPCTPERMANSALTVTLLRLFHHTCWVIGNTHSLYRPASFQGIHQWAGSEVCVNLSCSQGKPFLLPTPSSPLDLDLLFIIAARVTARCDGWTRSHEMARCLVSNPRLCL